MRRSYSGRFRPKNHSKYKGDINNITWRSTWELKFFNWCDNHPSILEWSSEEISIPYISPIDNKLHRYFPDVFIKLKDADGKTIKKLVEIKPEKQTTPPRLQKKITPKYLTEIKTWGINEAKWNAAKRFCDEMGWEFVHVTENDLGLTVK